MATREDTLKLWARRQWYVEISRPIQRNIAQAQFPVWIGDIEIRMK